MDPFDLFRNCPDFTLLPACGQALSQAEGNTGNGVFQVFFIVFVEKAVKCAIFYLADFIFQFDRRVFRHEKN